MERSLPLEKGEIILSEDKITIRDNARRYKWERVFYSGIWVFYGIVAVGRYTKTGDQFLLWSGLVIGVLHLGAIVFRLLESTINQIEVKEIKAAVFKKRFGALFLRLELKSGGKRHINKIEPIADELKAFFEGMNIETR
ncbi:hypothetical protein [uncultured Pontibacter sp.]|uniref:hypothetical protein n=1 Tax=uncultured Pontibacter sp. TaxID=453356 RepID=UPI0026108D0D|nr:hypothetical protein [uncultured Pontibacter sp.]